jgi:cardiolipin synthase
VLGRHQDGWAAVLLGVAGLSDNLDGYIARRFDQISRLGQLLDPIVDRVQVVVALVVLVLARALPWYLAALLVLREVVLAVVIAVLRRAGHGSLPVHYLGKIGTFGTVAALPLLLLGHGRGVATPLATAGTVLGSGFFYWGLTLYWCAGAVYVWQARRLLRPPSGIATRPA